MRPWLKWGGIVFLVFYVVTSPTAAAQTTGRVLDLVTHGFTQLGRFLSAL